MSLIASCALHGIEPWAYLRDVLIRHRAQRGSRPPKAPAQRGEAPGGARGRCHPRLATAELLRRVRLRGHGRQVREPAGSTLRPTRFHDA
ncbi:transposase domain-containing protein [Sorangium sp. So ce887]|uniref:transposase domain-containing protein n=1 Tax=Sorangium sp. So ce887 TaxID=3133324 RepID=UPI003F63CADC